MTKMIDSGISVDHARSWDEPEALRELLQNYIDARNEWAVSGEVLWENGKAIIHDHGPGLDMKAFAFGYNNKVEGSIGQFGEGMKSGIVTIIRNNKSVVIETNNIKIIPMIMPSSNFGNLNTLHYQIEALDEPITGTKIIVECSQAALEKGKDYFTEFLDIIWLEHNKISLPAGRIYVNNSKISDLDYALFSYHLWGKNAQSIVSRDRDSVDMNKAKDLIGVIIQSTTSIDVISMVLKDIVQPNKEKGCHFEANLRMRPWNTKELWQLAWKNNFGNRNYCTSSGVSYDKSAESKGYKVLHLTWNQASILEDFCGVPDAETIALQSAVEGGLTPIHELPEVEKENIRWAIKMVNKYYHCYLPEKKVMVAQLKERAMATYDPSADIMTISNKLLFDRTELLACVMHESVHMHSGYNDLTSEFQNEYDTLVSEIIIKAEKELGNAS